MTIELSSPIEASRVFGAAGAPRQRHVFLVRFAPNVAAVATTYEPQTFVVKHCDRPKVTIKNEEMNQYNKKRIIYTGFKLEPIKMTFYDDAKGEAQSMWAAYSQYYFGDFVKDADKSYQYDITTAGFQGSNFGLSEGYGGDTNNDAQWFFSSITIFHFYYSGSSRQFDSYQLFNPRIISYEPDDLDYETANVSQINMQFVYENLQYTPGQKWTSAAFEEFTNGGFFGNPIVITDTPPSSAETTRFDPSQPISPNPKSLLATAPSAPSIIAPYRAEQASSTGSLEQFGKFNFGSPSTPAASFFGTGTPSIAGGSGTPNIASIFTNNLPSIAGGSGGITPSAAALSAINSQQTGTAQYGVSSLITNLPSALLA